MTLLSPQGALKDIPEIGGAGPGKRLAKFLRILPASEFRATEFRVGPGGRETTGIGEQRVRVVGELSIRLAGGILASPSATTLVIEAAKKRDGLKQPKSNERFWRVRAYRIIPRGNRQMLDNYAKGGLRRKRLRFPLPRVIICGAPRASAMLRPMIIELIKLQL